MRGFIASVDRYLKKFRYSESVITGQSFANTRDVLKSKQKQLKRLGKRNRPQEAAPLTDDEITALFTSNVMGIHSPEVLVNILWLNNCLHFGLRGGNKEQRDLQWGDIELKTDLNGKEYLEYSVIYFQYILFEKTVLYIINRKIHGCLEIPFLRTHVLFSI